MDENRPKSGQPISLTGGAVKPLRATSVLARIQISIRDTIRTFHVNIMIAMNRIIVTVVFNPRRTGREKPQPVLCAFLFTHALLPYKRYGFIHARARTFIFLTTNFFFFFIGNDGNEKSSQMRATTKHRRGVYYIPYVYRFSRRTYFTHHQRVVFLLYIKNKRKVYLYNIVVYTFPTRAYSKQHIYSQQPPSTPLPSF